MIPDGTYTAVVDRIEDGLATLEVDGDGDRYGLDVDPAALPESARRAGAVVEVELEDGELCAVSYDEAATEERAERAQDRFDRLSRRPDRDDVDDSE